MYPSPNQVLAGIVYGDESTLAVDSVLPFGPFIRQDADTYSSTGGYNTGTLSRGETNWVISSDINDDMVGPTSSELPEGEYVGSDPDNVVTLAFDPPLQVGTLDVPGSDDPDKRVGVIVIRDGAGNAKEGAVIRYQLLSLIGDDGSGFDDDVLEVTTGEDGVATLTFVVDGVYQYWGDNGQRRTIAITAETEDPFDLPSIIV